MLNKKTRGIATALVITFTTLAAAAPPVVIDSEQKADAAVLAAFRIKSTPLGHLHFVTNYARGQIEDALLKVGAATTPAGLMSMRNGLTLPCAGGGTLTAKMARTFPRVVKLGWSACKFTDIDGYARERAGSAEVVLVSDSFTPGKVAAIRFGSATSDFIDKRLVVYDDQITDETRSLNLRMVGLIPMQRAFPLYGLFVGDFAFETTGFYNEHDHYEFPLSPIPPFDADSGTSMEHLLASGSITYTNARTHSVEDARFHSGTVTSTSRQDGYPDTMSKYTVDGFRSRREFDQPAATWQESLDGRIDLQYPTPDPYSPGCQSGAYVFKTRAPVVRNLTTPYEFDSGDLLINGVVARFYTAATTPAGLPAPVDHNLIHLEVPNVGQFNYDSNGVTALREATQCWN
jgi:hypothetical protein